MWIWAAPLAAVLAALALYGYYGSREAADDGDVLPTTAEESPAPALPTEEVVNPAISRPAAALPEPLASLPPPDPDPEVPLPPLDDSDAVLRGWLEEDLAGAAALQYLRPRRVARHFVATLDNVPNERLAPQRLPVTETPGPFIASGTADEPVLDEQNFGRYAPLVAAVGALDPHALVAAYHRAYPLLQQAYVELGYPNSEFNTRMLEVIEHLLETPDVHGPIALDQPHVLYTFADPELEALSAGQKALLRMGPANAAVIKQKLRDVRAALIARASGEAQAISATRETAR